ncbi:MAG: hypothetical protein ACI8PT_002984 [Gammaproteobacteria bacterium]|jgi:uncharacterized protein (DUF697 family)
MDEQEVAATDKQVEALKIVNQHMAVAAGVGFIPIPIIDIVALTGVQLNMLHSVSKLYDVPFSANLVKSLVSSLVGGALPAKAAWGATGSLVKSIPIVGTYLGWATMPALSGAVTYAVGRVFVEHFESGGSFLTFRPSAAREQMAEHMDTASSDTAAADSAEPVAS